ncbi:hypothetical protein EYC80_002662 [Monilinia laxa]|uniref:Uncharacterized protein n=1 Tax=Monilinia laxa TaxID=61186 RepID=A0A5N6K4N0_MONLA|nr:hypothetical protein EYC80_002662 [Monilinia laxa]
MCKKIYLYLLIYKHTSHHITSHHITLHHITSHTNVCGRGFLVAVVDVDVDVCFGFYILDVGCRMKG